MKAVNSSDIPMKAVKTEEDHPEEPEMQNGNAGDDGDVPIDDGHGDQDVLSALDAAVAQSERNVIGDVEMASLAKAGFVSEQPVILSSEQVPLLSELLDELDLSASDRQVIQEASKAPFQEPEQRPTSHTLMPGHEFRAQEAANQPSQPQETYQDTALEGADAASPKAANQPSQPQETYQDTALEGANAASPMETTKPFEETPAPAKPIEDKADEMPVDMDAKPFEETPAPAKPIEDKADEMPVDMDAEETPAPAKPIEDKADEMPVDMDAKPFEETPAPAKPIEDKADEMPVDMDAKSGKENHDVSIMQEGSSQANHIDMKTGLTENEGMNQDQLEKGQPSGSSVITQETAAAPSQVELSTTHRKPVQAHAEAAETQKHNAVVGEKRKEPEKEVIEQTASAPDADDSQTENEEAAEPPEGAAKDRHDDDGDGNNKKKKEKKEKKEKQDAKEKKEKKEKNDAKDKKEKEDADAKDKKEKNDADAKDKKEKKAKEDKERTSMKASEHVIQECLHPAPKAAQTSRKRKSPGDDAVPKAEAPAAPKGRAKATAKPKACSAKAKAAAQTQAKASPKPKPKPKAAAAQPRSSKAAKVGWVHGWVVSGGWGEQGHFCYFVHLMMLV